MYNEANGGSIPPKEALMMMVGLVKCDAFWPPVLLDKRKLQTRKGAGNVMGGSCWNSCSDLIYRPLRCRWSGNPILLSVPVAQVWWWLAVPSGKCQDKYCNYTAIVNHLV